MNIEISKSNRDGKKLKAVIDGKKDHSLRFVSSSRLHKA